MKFLFFTTHPYKQCALKNDAGSHASTCLL